MSAEGIDQDPPKKEKKELQYYSNGYGKGIFRDYEVNVKDSKYSAKDMFEKIRNDFSDFVEGEGYFENISSQNAMEIGDEISIVGGPGFGKSKAEPIHEEFAPDQVDKEGNLYTAFVRTGVTVTNIVEEKDSYSMTFQTWKGHVEAGSINFTVFQGSDKNITMKISSIARNSNIATAFGYYYLGGKAGQIKIWTTFLKNFVKYSGGQENGIKY